MLQILERAIEQRVRVSDDAGERGSQLMRHIGDEILAHLLQTFQIGDVVEDRDRAGTGRGFERSGVRLKRAGVGGG